MAGSGFAVRPRHPNHSKMFGGKAVNDVSQNGHDKVIAVDCFLGKYFSENFFHCDTFPLRRLSTNLYILYQLGRFIKSQLPRRRTVSPPN